MAGKRILIVTGSDYTPQVYEAFVQLKREGYSLFLLSDGLFSPREGIFEKTYAYDLRRTVEVLAYLEREKLLVDAVAVKSSEWLTPLVALIAERWGLVGNTPRTAFLCRSKYHMRKRMADAGIASPQFQIARNFTEIESAARSIGFPCVAKPIGGNASYGTFLIESEASLPGKREVYENSLRYLQKLAVADDMFAFSHDELRLFGESEYFDLVNDYLIEEFIPGPEISIDSIVQRGRTSPFGIAEQVRMKPPYFVQEAEFMPFVGGDSLEREILDLNRRTIEAFGITDSPVHLEIILSPDGPRVVELACRIGGDNIHDAVFQTTGWNLMHEAVMTALGIEREYTISRHAHTAMQYLLPTRRGILDEIRVPEEVTSNPLVTEIEITAKPGAAIVPPPESFEFLGYIQTRGRTREEAAAILSHVLGEISIVMK